MFSVVGVLSVCAVCWCCVLRLVDDCLLMLVGVVLFVIVCLCCCC